MSTPEPEKLGHGIEFELQYSSPTDNPLAFAALHALTSELQKRWPGSARTEATRPPPEPAWLVIRGVLPDGECVVVGSWGDKGLIFDHHAYDLAEPDVVGDLAVAVARWATRNQPGHWEAVFAASPDWEPVRDRLGRIVGMEKRAEPAEAA